MGILHIKLENIRIKITALGKSKNKTYFESVSHGQHYKFNFKATTSVRLSAGHILITVISTTHAPVSWLPCIRPCPLTRRYYQVTWASNI